MKCPAVRQIPLLAAVLVASATQADEVPRPQEVAALIDSAIDTRLTAANLSTGGVAGDVEFLRRAHLDLNGRIPSAEKARAFLESRAPDKRARLIDELLAESAFGVHLGRVWRDWIAPAELPSEGNGGNQPIKATRNLGTWFAEQFNTDQPWNEIVKRVVTVDGNLKESPQGLFYSLVGTDTGIPEPAGATRAISSLFMGVDIQCAQCHDDPYRDWKQDDFWGAAAFFRNMQANFDGRYFASITESFGKPTGKGAKKVTTRDESPNGAITIPSSSFENAGSVVEGRYLLGEPLQTEDKEPLRPFFAEWLVSPKNPYFATAFVNRIWAHYFSRGLVEPIDDMRPENAPTHPKVLELLTAEFVDSGFDIKHLVRCLLNTRAYQRTSASQPTVPADQRETHRKASAAGYGRREVKLLSTDQLYESLKSALGNDSLDLRTYDANESKKFGESSPVGDEYMEFQRLFETDENDATNFTHGIPQFLALVNHPNVSSGGPAVEALEKESLQTGDAIETLYLSTLSRPPTDEELAEAKEFIEASTSRREGYAGVLWMLLNRSEFMLCR